MSQITDKFLAEKIASWQSSVKERQVLASHQDMEEQLYKEQNNIVQLPLWSDAIRGVPNCVLRGSLFAAIQAKDAKYCKRKLLTESSKFILTYTGERLTQSDLDVWETVLHLAREQNLGDKIYYTENAFLKKLGRSNGGKNKQWLKTVLSKLNATAIEITFKDKQNFSFEGSLLSQAYREESTGRFVLVLDSKLHRLFEEGNTWLSWNDRQKIGTRKPLAQWLHGYISSHVQWFPHKVLTIKELSGSETKQVRKFKQNLIGALEHLKDLELITEFAIDEKNLVYIERKLSKAQQRYLDEKS